jgi:phospholipase C
LAQIGVLLTKSATQLGELLILLAINKSLLEQDMARRFSLKHPALTTIIAAFASFILISLNTGCRGIVAAAPLVPAGPAATPITVTADINPAPVGAKVTFTAKVSDPTATGNVTFNNGNTALGTAALTSGSATISSSTLTPGSHSITAVYSGDATHGGSTSPALAEVINGLATTTTLTADLNPAQIGTKVTFKATVAPADATGNVTFNDGTTALGTAPLAAGVATFSTSTLALGSHTITAVYAGDATHASSTSAALTEVIQLVADIHAINHIVVMLQENRSFDSHFGKLGDYRAGNNPEKVTYGAATDIDGLPNPPPSNPQDATDQHVEGTVTAYHFQTACIENISPDWLESHGDYHRFDAGSNVFLGDGYVHNAQGMAEFSGFVTSSNQARGSVVVTPSTTTNYYLFANHSGAVLAQLAVNVTTTAANSFFADPQTISSGSTTLHWSVQKATSVSISDDKGTLVGTFPGNSGSTSVSPTVTTKYNLTATVPTGTTSLSTTVTVSATAGGLSFTASNSSIAAGQSVTLQWNVPNATSVLVDSWFDQEGRRAMGYYDGTDLPYYYFMASNFATSDRFFSPISSNSEPNRIYFFAATSNGHVHDPGTFPATSKNIFQLLDAAGITWKVYYQETDSHGAPNTRLSRFPQFEAAHMANVVPDSQFFTDLKNGTLPQVAYIEEQSGLDEHPGGTDSGNINSGNHVQQGASFASQHINAFMQSTAWKDGVFFLSWDEGGGLYDHVSPQPAVHPDGIKPVDLEQKDIQFITPQGDFNRTGFRVPLLVVSPYTKKSYVSHTVADYTAFDKFIETRFGLPSLTARDAAQIDMTEFFNFANPPWLTPPTPPAQPISLKCDFTNLH